MIKRANPAKYCVKMEAKYQNGGFERKKDGEIVTKIVNNYKN